MKKTLLAALFMCITFPVFSQNVSRLISSADTILQNNNYIQYDTTRYYYTGNRIVFDSSITRTLLPFNPPTVIVRSVNTFDNNNNILESKSESQSNGVWNGIIKYMMTYDASNRMTTKIDQNYAGNNSWVNHVKDSFVYNSSNDLVTSFQKNWNGSTFADAYKKTFTYDASHNILTSEEAAYNTSTQAWDVYGNEMHTYNANNAELTRIYQAYYAGNWHTDNADANIYNGSNLILHVRYYTNSQGIYTFQESDSNVYNGNNDNILSFGYFPNNGLPTYTKDTNVFDNAHNAIMQTEMSRNGLFSPWQNIEQTIKTFNTHHQPLTIRDNTWDAASQSWIPVLGRPMWLRFHYEEEETAVPAIVKNNFSVKLYPNPASSFITLDMKWNTPEKTQVAIYSITGALMMQWSEDAVTDMHRMVPVNTFPAGNYIIDVKGTTSRYTQQFSVVK